jgi:hypothetical protein
MTLDEVRTQARELSRVDSTAVSDARLNQLIKNTVEEFANDVGGFDKDDYPAISATFDTKTHFAIRVTIVGGTNEMSATDVALTTTDRSATTGTQVATDFQATLKAAIGAGANATVAWDDFAFTVDTIDGTSITFAEPDDENYADARDLLGLSGTTTEAAADVTGSFPEDCTIEYTLPTSLMYVSRVEWDGVRIHEVEPVMSPETSGTPYGYFVRGRNLHFVPAPDEQGLCKIWYRGVPDDLVFSGYQEVGLSGKSDESATGLSTSTTYYYKIAINGSAVTEYSIDVASDATFSAVIALMNAQNTGATWSLVGGDLRCTSDAVDGVSTIALSAGTTGTNLFETLTGWSAFDTAVDGDTDLPSEIPAINQPAIPNLIAYYLCLYQFDDKIAGMRRAEYAKLMRQFRVERHNRQTIPDDNGYERPVNFKVSM